VVPNKKKLGNRKACRKSFKGKYDQRYDLPALISPCKSFNE
jgi:hypothetical protein